MSDNLNSPDSARPHPSGRVGRDRFDGFTNILAEGMGWFPMQPPISGDNRLYSNMTRYWQQQSTNGDVEWWYNHRGVAATIIDRPADDCFSTGLKIDGDDDSVMMDEYDRLSVFTVFSDAIRWARLFGASVIAIMAKDGGGWNEPLNLDTIETIEDLKIYDKRQIKPTAKLYTDPADPKFGQPEFFDIYPSGGTSFEVHESRLIMISGDPMPLRNVRNTLWWEGKPVLDVCLLDLKRLEEALAWTVKLLERKQQGIYGMEGLGDLFAQGMDAIVSKRIGLVDYVRNNLNSVVVDSKDTFTVENLGLDNLNNVIAEFETCVCASSKFPSVILFGKSVSSLNSTGAGELEQYYGMVELIRTRIVKPALEQLTSILYLQQSFEGNIPDKWKIIFNPLWKPTVKEQADTDAVNATALSTEVTTLITLMDNAILMPEEVRRIIIDKYPDYDFPDAMKSPGGDKAYAESVGGDDEGSGDPLPGEKDAEA